MKKIVKAMLPIYFSAVSTLCLGQSAFRSCTAPFLNNKMVVDEYTPKGKCELAAESTGQLTVCTVDLSPTEGKAVRKLPFKVAIKDRKTQTLVLFTKSDVKQIDVERILAKCKKGDSIVLLTVDDQYAMPHNEILVQ